MKILLLGGTGAMGSHLVNILSEKGYKVSVTSRKKRDSSDFIEFLQGNAMDISFLKEVLKERWDVIVDFMVYTNEEFRDRVDLLLESTNQYIFLSSARVYNKSLQLMTEETARLLDSSLDDEFLAQNEYSLSKARQENRLGSSGMNNWTIVRPYITYSKNRLQLGTLEKENWLYRALKGRTIVFAEEMQNRFTTLTYGLDVANGIASLINNSKALGMTYHITNNKPYKWSNIIEIYLDVLEQELGCRPNVVYQDLDDFFVWNPGKYQIIYDRLYDRKFDNTRINEFINVENFHDLQTTLTGCLREFLIKPEFSYINWKSEAIKDRYCGERTPLQEISGLKQKIKYVLFRYILSDRKKYISKG